MAFPLIIDGRHVATVFTGQFFYDDDEVDVEAFRAQAAELGFDEAAYLEALERVPILSHAQVEQTIEFLADLAGMLADLGLSALDREKDHAALMDSEQRLRLANKATNDVVWDLDVASDVQLWNAAGATVFGWKGILDGPTPATWWSERVHPDDLGPIMADYDAILADHEATSWVADYRFRKADGTYAQVLDRGHVVRDGGGRPTRMIGAMLDITERQREEQELQESRDLMQLIIRHDPNAIAVFDTDLRYIFVSDSFLDDYGIRDDDVIGKTHYEVFPEIPERREGGPPARVEGSVARAEEDPFPRADGHVDWVTWECRPWHKADGSIGGMILYTELVTARRAAAEALRQSRRQYETFINATDDIAFLKDDELRYVIVNPASAAFFGREVEETSGAPTTSSCRRTRPPRAATATCVRSARAGWSSRRRRWATACTSRASSRSPSPTAAPASAATCATSRSSDARRERSGGSRPTSSGAWTCVPRSSRPRTASSSRSPTPSRTTFARRCAPSTASARSCCRTTLRSWTMPAATTCAASKARPTTWPG